MGKAAVVVVVLFIFWMYFTILTRADSALQSATGKSKGTFTTLVEWSERNLRNLMKVPKQFEGELKKKQKKIEKKMKEEREKAEDHYQADFYPPPPGSKARKKVQVEKKVELKKQPKKTIDVLDHDGVEVFKVERR